jgi:hypothetical protein
MHVAPTSRVAAVTQRMKCCSRNFDEHEGKTDVRGAARGDSRRKGPPRRSTRRSGYAGFALAPAAARRRSKWVFGKKNGDPHAEARARQAQGSPRHRDALTHIGDAKLDAS